jgi:hypothetical protein
VGKDGPLSDGFLSLTSSEILRSSEPLPYALSNDTPANDDDDAVSGLTLFLVGVAVVTWTLGREAVLDEGWWPNEVVRAGGIGTPCESILCL